MLSSLVSELSKGLTQTTELLEKNDARALSKWLDSTTDASKLPMTKLVRFGVSQALSPGSSPLMKANRDLSVALSPHQSDLNRLNGLLNASLDPKLPAESNAKLLIDLKTVLDALGQSEDVRKELLPLLRSKHQQLLAASSSPVFKLLNEKLDDDVIATVSGLMREARFNEALQELMNQVVLPLVPAVTQLDGSALPDVTTSNKKKGKGKKTKKKSSLAVSGMKMTMLELPSKISTSMLMHADNMLVPGSDVYEPKNMSTSMVVLTSGLSMKIEETYFSYERFSFPHFKRSGHIAIDVDNICLRFGLKATVPELIDTDRPSVSVHQPDQENDPATTSADGAAADVNVSDAGANTSATQTSAPFIPKQHFDIPMVVFETDDGNHDRYVTVKDMNIRMAKDVLNHKLLNGVMNMLHGTICAQVNDVLDSHMKESMDHLCILLNVAMMVQQVQQE